MAGHGDVLSDEFINWRIKLALNRQQPEIPPESEAIPPAEIGSGEALQL